MDVERNLARMRTHCPCKWIVQWTRCTCRQFCRLNQFLQREKEQGKYFTGIFPSAIKPRALQWESIEFSEKYIAPIFVIKELEEWTGLCFLHSRWFLAQLILWYWEWKQYIHPKQRPAFNGPHDAVLGDSTLHNQLCYNIESYFFVARPRTYADLIAGVRFTDYKYCNEGFWCSRIGTKQTFANLFTIKPDGTLKNESWVHALKEMWIYCLDTFQSTF
jgi:hypothetical protein